MTVPALTLETLRRELAEIVRAATEIVETEYSGPVQALLHGTPGDIADRAIAGPIAKHTAALEAENARLRSALEPFSEMATAEGRRGLLAFSDGDDEEDCVRTDGTTFDELPDDQRAFLLIKTGDLRRARTALQGASDASR